MKKNNKMKDMPVNKLMISTGIPMILSMMLQAVYNIVDSAFVGRIKDIGEDALNALTLAFPVQMLMIAIAIGTGVGMGAVVSMQLGQKNREYASKTAGNAIFLASIIYIIFLLFGIFGVKSYISSQTSNLIVIDIAMNYLRICCIMSFGVVFFAVFEKLLQATGNSLYSTIAQVVGALINIILDPILIYGWLGNPALGVNGAAYATVIGQIASLALAFMFHIRKNIDIRNGLVYMRPSWQIIQQIYAIGIPAIIAQALMSVMTYGLNLILVKIDESVVTAYGIYYKVQQFILFAAFGLRDAITPIVSYSYGSQDKHRIQDGIKYGQLYTIIIMLVGTILMELLAGSLSELFGLSGETKVICVSAMRVISISFVFAGANIAFQGIFQALESGKESLLVSICRQFLFVLPVAEVFSRIIGNHINRIWLVWLSFIIAESASCLISVLLMKKIQCKKLSFQNFSDVLDKC